MVCDFSGPTNRRFSENLVVAGGATRLVTSQRTWVTRPGMQPETPRGRLTSGATRLRTKQRIWVTRRREQLRTLRGRLTGWATRQRAKPRMPAGMARASLGQSQTATVFTSAHVLSTLDQSSSLFICLCVHVYGIWSQPELHPCCLHCMMQVQTHHTAMHCSFCFRLSSILPSPVADDPPNALLSCITTHPPPH